MTKYESLKHSKFKIRYHIIFSTKYRKKLLIDNNIKQAIISYMKEAENKDFRIEIQETDRDHIHFLICATPNIAPYQIVHALKQKSTYLIWKNFRSYMSSY